MPIPCSDLEARLAHLERRVRWQRNLISALLFVATAALLMGEAAPPQGNIKARAFTLVDAEGNTLARLGGGKEHGTPRLHFYGADGKVGVQLGILESGPTLQLIRGDGGRAGLMAAQDGSRLWAQDASGVSSSLIASHDGGVLLLSDGEKKNQAILRADKKGGSIDLLEAKQGVTFSVPDR